MRYVLVDGQGAVVNTVELESGWDSAGTIARRRWTAPEGLIVIQSDEAGPGWSHAGGRFVKPSDPPRPSEIPSVIDDILRRLAALEAVL